MENDEFICFIFGEDFGIDFGSIFKCFFVEVMLCFNELFCEFFFICDFSCEDSEVVVEL